MTRQHFFIVLVFLVFSLALSGMLFGQRVIDLDKLWGDMRVLGGDIDDLLGYAVAYGDINGNGYNDIIIGAPYASTSGLNSARENHLVSDDCSFVTAYGLGGISWIKDFNLLGDSWNSLKALEAVNFQDELNLEVRNFDSETFLICDSPECDFATIKSAIKSPLVKEGDIIKVLQGTYQECNIIIDKKNITIIGQEGAIDSTIINGKGSEEIFKIQAPGVTIKGLTITNCDRAIFIDHKKNCQIIGNKFNQIGKAVLLLGSHENYIANNVIENVAWLGINLVYSNKNQIKENTIDNSNKEAIILNHSRHNALISNSINNIYWWGIRLKASSHNEVSNNHLESPDWAAIFLSYASDYNTVTENIINDKSQGIDSNLGISITSSSNNTIKNNIIKNCNHNIFIYQNKNEKLGGTEIPTENIIEENTAEDGKDGILLRAAKNNEIKNNIIKDNDRGLVIFSSSAENSAIGNIITHNNQEGILIHPDSPGNIISGNVEHSNNLGDYTFSFPSELNLYWGDIHGHTNKSDGSGSVDEYYEYARDIAKLDICAISDHGSSPRVHRMDQSDWKFIRERAKHYYQPHEFVTFSGYEWTETQNYGHHNIYYLTDDDGLPLIPARGNPNYYNTTSISELLSLIRNSGKDFIIIPHHGFISEQSVGDHRYCFQNPPQRVAAEICSIHGRSEFYQNQSLRTWQTSSYANIQDGLKAGIGLGILSSSDTHMSLPGEWGIFVVYAEDLTRESIFDSIKKRRTYGTTGPRIGLWFEINNHIIGEEVSLSGNPTIYVKLKGEKEIHKIEVIKHIENSSQYPFLTVHSEYPDQREFEFKWTDTDFTENSLYYIRVTQKDGEMAWSSPIWLNKSNPN